MIVGDDQRRTVHAQRLGDDGAKRELDGRRGRSEPQLKSKQNIVGIEVSDLQPFRSGVGRQMREQSSGVIQGPDFSKGTSALHRALL
jgi:hypothetical protein